MCAWVIAGNCLPGLRGTLFSALIFVFHPTALAGALIATLVQICRPFIESSRITHRDTKSYFGILLDDNNRKPICRLHLDRSKKYVETFDKNKKGTKHIIENIDDIYNHKEHIIESLKNNLDDALTS